MEEIWIRDGKKSYPGSGINIPDPTLVGGKPFIPISKGGSE
jgi:hypothetical protein